MESLPLWANALIFLAAAAAVGSPGSRCRTRRTSSPPAYTWARRSAGVVLLAVATNLPEIAITASAALRGNIGVAVGNILGGIAIQTVVLVALDAFGMRGASPLTYRAASLVLVAGGRSSSWRCSPSSSPGPSCPTPWSWSGSTPAAVLIAVALGRRAAPAQARRARRCRGTSPARPRTTRTSRGATAGTRPRRTATEQGRQHGDVGHDLRRRRARHPGGRGGARAQRRRDRRPHRPVRGALRRHRPRRRHLVARAVHGPDVGPARRLPARRQRHLRRQRLPARAVPAGHRCCRARPCCPQAHATDIYLTALGDAAHRSSTSRACCSAPQRASPGWASTPSSCWCSTSSACSACSPLPGRPGERNTPLRGSAGRVKYTQELRARRRSLCSSYYLLPEVGHVAHSTDASSPFPHGVLGAAPPGPPDTEGSVGK